MPPRPPLLRERHCLPSDAPRPRPVDASSVINVCLKRGQRRQVVINWRECESANSSLSEPVTARPVLRGLSKYLPL